jgi:hypothetical protein
MVASKTPGATEIRVQLRPKLRVLMGILGWEARKAKELIAAEIELPLPGRVKPGLCCEAPVSRAARSTIARGLASSPRNGQRALRFFILALLTLLRGKVRSSLSRRLRVGAQLSVAAGERRIHAQ